MTKIPIANCSLSSNCTSCLGNGNPLCGWCVVENKCSRTSECQNPETRWIRAAGTNTGQCTAISISPQQFDLDAPEIVRINVQFGNLMVYDLCAFVFTADPDSLSASPSSAGE